MGTVGLSEEAAADMEPIEVYATDVQADAILLCGAGGSGVDETRGVQSDPESVRLSHRPHRARGR